MVPEAIRPTARKLVFDLVEEAGLDVTDWIESFKKGSGYKANPKYCYEWSFIEPGKLVILNLWFSGMRPEAGRIVLNANYRADAKFNRSVLKKASWARRGLRLDEHIQAALRDNLPIRVIINDGRQRDQNDPALKPSSVAARELDPEPWTVADYDWATGEAKLIRGILDQPFVDQFDLNLAEKADPTRTEVTSSQFIRNPAVRRLVLTRSNGKCELCGRPGFAMPNGSTYLETHHVAPLSLGGPDIVSNVVALCADDHRRAHYAVNRDEIASRLRNVLEQLKR